MGGRGRQRRRRPDQPAHDGPFSTGQNDQGRVRRQLLRAADLRVACRRGVQLPCRRAGPTLAAGRPCQGLQLRRLLRPLRQRLHPFTARPTRSARPREVRTRGSPLARRGRPVVRPVPYPHPAQRLLLGPGAGGRSRAPSPGGQIPAGKPGRVHLHAGNDRGLARLLDGAVFPVCPGCVAGRFSPEAYEFHNFSVVEVIDHLDQFFDLLAGVNPPPA